MRTPRQVRNCLSYVLNNWRRHEEDRRSVAKGWKVDPFSSGAYFSGWKELEGKDLFWPVRKTYRPLLVWRPKT